MLPFYKYKTAEESEERDIRGEIAGYMFKIWAIATFIPALMTLWFPIFTLMIIVGGFIIIPFFIPLYFIIKDMYKSTTKDTHKRIVLSFCFMVLVSISVLITGWLVMEAEINFAGIIFAFPVFLAGLIAIWTVKMPAEIKE